MKTYNLNLNAPVIKPVNNLYNKVYKDAFFCANITYTKKSIQKKSIRYFYLVDFYFVIHFICEANMSNERTANGGRLTRAMHKAAAALYSATVLGGGSDRGADDERERADELARSESTVADSQAPEAQQEGEVRAECHAPVPDIPSVQH